MINRWLHAMLTTLFIVAFFVLVVWLVQRRLIYFPDGDVPSSAAYGLPHAEVVTLETDDGLRLRAWFVPAGAPSANGTIVVFNGNAGHRGHRAAIAARFAAHGFATLLVDYRGYGGNPGHPSEAGLARDARAAWAHVASRPDVDPSRVVYFGESLGAAVAIRLAVEHPPAALVLRSPFSSLAALGQRHYPFLPVRWMLKDRFESIERIGALTCPILVIAGDADRIVPFDDTQVLYDAARHPKRLVVIRGAGHNDAALIFGPEVVQAIVDFVRQ